MAAADIELSKGQRHELARWAAALCFVYEGRNVGAAVARFKRDHPHLVNAAAKRLDKFIRYWGQAGFDDKGRLQVAPPHGRPAILSEPEAQKAADAVGAGTIVDGMLRTSEPSAKLCP